MADSYSIRGDEIPRAADDPCDPDCPGWSVFDCGDCTVHDGPHDETDGCSVLMIDACIDCWHGVPDAPGPEYYQSHPVCLKQLATERAAERAAWAKGVARDDTPFCNCGTCTPGDVTCVRDD